MEASYTGGEVKERDRIRTLVRTNTAIKENKEKGRNKDTRRSSTNINAIHTQKSLEPGLMTGLIRYRGGRKTTEDTTQ